jgi:hypothetical protein
MSLRQISREVSAESRSSAERVSSHVVRRQLDRVAAKIALINRMRLASVPLSAKLSPEALERGLKAGDFLGGSRSQAHRA